MKYIDSLGDDIVPLFKALPLDLWLPSKDDIDQIASFLKKDLESSQSIAGQYIITNLGWPEDDNISKWILTPQIQKYIGLMLVEVSQFHSKC